jgi:hypothetical protein
MATVKKSEVIPSGGRLVRASRARTTDTTDRETRTTTPAATTPTEPPVNARVRAPDAFDAPRTRKVELNPEVSAAVQRATWQRVFDAGRAIVADNKIPVIVIDHRLTGLDDRPIIKKGLTALAQMRQMTELLDVDAALRDGTLKSLPGYTAEASDHWRDQHPALVAKYADVLGQRGTRLNLGFMSYSPRDANAAPGLKELIATWTLETSGKGRVAFVGAGSGTVQDMKSVYERAIVDGGAGLKNVDARLGSPAASGAAQTRAQALVDAYNAAHPNEAPVLLDNDSSGKAGFVEQIEQERGPNNEETVVAAFIDDRAHNRFGVLGAGKRGTDLVAVRAAAPGLSASQVDKDNPNLISTFHPLPR